MNGDAKLVMGVFVVWVLWSLACLAFSAAAIYVVIHFILKCW